MRRWKIAAIVVALLALIYFGGPVVVDIAVRGARLSRSTWDAADMQTIAEDPEDLTAQAADVVGQSVDADEYAAARMCRSEEGHASDFVKRCLIQTAINDAERHGWTLLRALTVSSVSARTGRFGHQVTRRYSTAVDPFDSDLQVARQAIADHAAGIDDAQGAEKFVNIGAFATPTKYAEVTAAWAREGLSPFRIDGVPSQLVFFRRGAA